MTSSEFGTMRLARSKVSISVERTEMRLTVPCSPPTTTQSPDLDRTLDQQNETGDEVVDDRLQAEADADGERAGDDREIGDVEAGVGEWR